MQSKAWFLVGMLGIACIVPDVEVIEDSDDDDTPTSGKSSKASNGGTSSTNGGTDGGTDGGAAPSAGSGTSPGGTGSSPTGSAVGKFCNDITVDGQNFPLTLTIGTANEQTVFTADSGTCRPINGKACSGIPVGTDLTLSLLAEDVEIVSYTVEVADGDGWIFLAYTDGESVDVAADPVTDAVCRLGYGTSTPDP